MGSPQKNRSSFRQLVKQKSTERSANCQSPEKTVPAPEQGKSPPLWVLIRPFFSFQPSPSILPRTNASNPHPPTGAIRGSTPSILSSSLVARRRPLAGG